MYGNAFSGMVKTVIVVATDRVVIIQNQTACTEKRQADYEV
jgi:hypothetical protein